MLYLQNQNSCFAYLNQLQIKPYFPHCFNERFVHIFHEKILKMRQKSSLKYDRMIKYQYGDQKAWLGAFGGHTWAHKGRKRQFRSQ